MDEHYKIDLEFDDLARPPQEIVLRYRHGPPNPEIVFSHDEAWITFVERIRAQVRSREIQFRGTATVPSLSARIHISGIYRYKRKIYYILPPTLWIDYPTPVPLRNSLVQALQMAGWMTECYYGTGPLEIVAVQHYLSSYTTLRDLRIEFQDVTPVKPLPNSSGEATLYHFLTRLGSALALADNCLPPCTDADRHATPWDPWFKCAYMCQGQDTCVQRREQKR